MIAKYGDHVMFQEDRAKYHHAKAIKAVKEAAGMKLCPHPAQPPDLNPIENIWRFIRKARLIRKLIRELNNMIHKSYSIQLSQFKHEIIK